jgi:hypothetical protein
VGGSSSSSTASTQTTATQNLNLQEISGVAVAGVDGNVSITATDQGTVDAARDIATNIIDAGAGAFQETVDLADAAIASGERGAQSVVDAGVRFGQEAGDLARDVLFSGERLTETSLDFARGSQGDALDFARDAQSDSFRLVELSSMGFNETVGGLVEDFLAIGENLVGDVLEFAGGSGARLTDAAAAIQARESGNTDARLEDITRYALIGAVVLGGAAIYAAARK